MSKTNHLKNPAWRGLLLQYAGLLSALLLLIVAFSLKTNHFVSLTALRAISNQIPDAVMLAVGMTLVMIVGGIDLSVGSVMALSGALLGVCLAQWHWPLAPALADCAAVLQCARLSSADPNAGAGAELQAIAACVIGGASLSGGRGSVVNTFFGVLLIAVLGAGLAQIGAQEPTRRFVTGCVILAAVILDVYRARLSRGE